MTLNVVVGDPTRGLTVTLLPGAGAAVASEAVISPRVPAAAPIVTTATSQRLTVAPV